MEIIAGEWHYTTTESGVQIDVYLGLYADYTFDLYQKIGDGPHYLYICIGQNMLFSVKKFFVKIARNPNVYAGFVDFCPIIPYSSTRRTMPVAFIYVSP